VKVEVLPSKVTDLNIQEAVETLAHLAWHEAVEKAEEILPILVTDESKVITGAINIKRYLEEMTR
jgi:disulfide oxidoreductase YuzD